MTRRPARGEAEEYYFGYINQVPGNLVLPVLASQLGEMLALFDGISDEQSLHRYAPDKWTIRQALSHVNDAERLFGFRAFWFARGFESPLPSFDQDLAVKAAAANDLQWRTHVEDFRAIRGATLTFFRGLPAAAWDRRGVASENPFSVRALAYITAGHAIHHNRILRERYLSPSR
jgi:DinB family protein